MKIKNYKFGSMTIGNITYHNDLIIFPNKIKSNWWRNEGHNLQMEDIQEVLSFKPEVLVIGTGKFGLMKVDNNMVKTLDEQGIKLIVEKTSKAVEKFNAIQEEASTVAAFHLTC
ncbi:MAG: hypothetical protein KAT54_03900 [Candidatus Marinimicrobia bacterium]|nr:hypothetical protein [Candidatus Neomarinimicrobiota bacterium]